MVDAVTKRSATEPQWTSRRSWLIPGAVLTAIFGWMFVVGLTLQPVLSAIGLGIVVACYVAMCVVAVVIRDADQRSGVLAWCMGTMATSAVVLVVIVLVVEANRLIGSGTF